MAELFSLFMGKEFSGPHVYVKILGFHCTIVHSPYDHSTEKEN